MSATVEQFDGDLYSRYTPFRMDVDWRGLVVRGKAGTVIPSRSAKFCSFKAEWRRGISWIVNLRASSLSKAKLWV